MPKFNSEQEERVQKTLGMMESKEDPNIALYARLYTVDYQQLKRRYHGTPAVTSNGGANTQLSEAQDRALVLWIKRQAKHGFPLKPMHVVGAGNWILQMANPEGATAPKPLSKQWFARWVKRHPEYHIIVTTPLETERKEAGNTTMIGEWFEKLRTCITLYGIGPRDLWNMDETGFMVAMLKACKVLVPREIKKCYVRNPSVRDMVTCVEAVSAAGEYIPSMMILKGTKLFERSFFDTGVCGNNHDPQTKWTTTKSGYIDEEKTLQWIEHFDNLTRQHQEGAYRLLLLDGHASHTRPAFIEACWKRNIIPFCLPPHSTHLLQPLDVAVFQPYKHFHAIVIENAVRAGVYNWGKDDFLAAQPWIKKQAFKKSTIKNAFKYTGIYPLDPKRVLKKLKD
jgi:hypothetical protein